jgi:hypothetical protein
MLCAQSDSNIVILKFRKARERTTRVSDVVPEFVRELTSDELGKMDTFEKALVSLVFSIRNLNNGDISLNQAESQAANVIAILKKRFSGC